MIWVLVLATWEAAYRTIGWKSWVFPAPSHIVDALLDLLNVQTVFGDPLHKGWPFPHAIPAAQNARTILHSDLIEANLVSGVRLSIGFAISIVLAQALAC